MTTLSLDNHRLDLGLIDDSMELSSDHGHDAEDYIEIDQEIGVVDNADFMIDDEQTGQEHGDALESFDDDLMSDDDQQVPTGNEAMMTEDDNNFLDEELDDASSIDEDNLDVTEVHIVERNEASFHASPSGLASSETTPKREPTTIAKAVIEKLSEVNDDTEDESREPLTSVSHQSNFVNEEHLARAQIPTASPPSATRTVDETLSRPASPRSTAQVTKANSQGEEEGTDLFDQSESIHEADIGEASEQPNPEHYLSAEIMAEPIKVSWNGTEMYLFPPSDSTASETFLLQDTALAHKPLPELFRSCRDLLGDSIQEGHELLAFFETLDLTVSEDMIDPPNTTLVTLLELYVALIQKDEVADRWPFTIHLTTQWRYSHRLTYLYAALEQGKSLGEIQAEEEVLADLQTENVYATDPEEGHDDTGSDEYTGQESQESNVVPEAATVGDESQLQTEGLGSAVSHPEGDDDSAEKESADVVPLESGAPITTLDTADGSSRNIENTDDLGMAHDELELDPLSTLTDSHHATGSELLNGDDANVNPASDQAADDLDDLEDEAADRGDKFNYNDNNVGSEDLGALAYDPADELSAELLDDPEDTLNENVITAPNVENEPKSADSQEAHISSGDHPLASLAHTPLLKQYGGLIDEDELTFSEDEIDIPQDEEDLPSKQLEVKASLARSAPEQQPTTQKPINGSSNQNSTAALSPPTLPRKRSFREQDTTQKIEDGGDHKKIRPS